MKKSLLCCLFLLVANLMMADGVVVVDGMKFVIDTETNQVSLTSVEITPVRDNRVSYTI